MGRAANGVADQIPAWHARAYCRWAGEHWTLFFPRTGMPGRATADAAYDGYCGLCPVRVQCLEAAMAGGESGVWAGTTDDDRRKLSRIRGRSKCPVCLSGDPVQIVAGRRNGRVVVDQICRACGHSWKAETNASPPLPGSLNDRRREQRARKAVAS
jgi:WhiB family transcriptional regulator, redox-sensing transcriptional regulator